MKRKFHSAVVLLLFGASQLQSAQAQGTAFTYQGQLMNNGSPANGNFDFKLQLYPASTGGGLVAGPVTNAAVAVSNGYFITLVDFGPGVFVGGNNWLHLAVQTNGGDNFISLSPRELLTPTPYALFATSASNLSGTLPAGELPVGVVTNNGSGVDLTGTFFGDGTGLMNVDAGTLAGLSAINFWQLGGNNVTGGQFIGSTNNEPVEIWAAGQRAFRLEPDTTGSGSPNVIGGSIGNFMNAGGVIGGFIGGGENNRIKAAADHAVIGGGIANTNNGEFGVIGGGQVNTVSGNSAVVGGGQNGTASGTDATVAGGYQNTASGTSSTVGGGGLNNAGGNSSTVSGGSANSVAGPAAAVGGGVINVASGNTSRVGGGSFNVASGDYSTVGGGANNSAAGTNATVAGGTYNGASNSWAAVSGGYQNIASVVYCK